LAKNNTLHCTVASLESFLFSENDVLVTKGAELENEVLIVKQFANPVTPDYVFFYNVSDDPAGGLIYYKLLNALAARGIAVSYDEDASCLGIKSILEQRCSEFEHISGLVIPRPKTCIIKGPADKEKISRFLNEAGPCILKPHNSSRARGIRLLVAESQAEQLILDNDRYVLQQLVANPMTMNGYKIGLRIYLLISDLRKPAYTIAEEGLVKCAVQPYMRGNPEAEIVGSSYAKRLGFVPVTYLLKDLMNTTENNMPSWKAIRASIEKTIYVFMEAVAWRAGMHHNTLPSFQMWGIDIAIQLTNDGPEAYLIEVNPFPALYRNDLVTDNATDSVFADELFAKAVCLEY
jgi:hypothetical protein